MFAFIYWFYLYYSWVILLFGFLFSQRLWNTKCVIASGRHSRTFVTSKYLWFIPKLSRDFLSAFSNSNMCLYSKDLDTVSHLLWCFLYSFLALVFVTSILPIWLCDHCRCAFLMATCIKAKGRADFSPTLYATKVLHNDGFEGWLTCCDLTKWWMSSHWQGGNLKYHLFFLYIFTPPLISPPAIPL